MQEEAGTSLTTSPPPSDPDLLSSVDPLSMSVRRSGPTRSRLYAVLVGVAVVTVALDQLTKVWALQALQPGVPRPLIGEWIRLNLIRNSGAAFSLGDGVTWLLTLLSVVIVAVILHQARRIVTTAWAVTTGLILGGAVGNLIDRVVREPAPFRGHVVDFLDYFGLFIGNVADIAIVAAAVAIVALTFRSPAAHGDWDDAAGVTQVEDSVRDQVRGGER